MAVMTVLLVMMWAGGAAAKYLNPTARLSKKKSNLHVHVVVDMVTSLCISWLDFICLIPQKRAEIWKTRPNILICDPSIPKCNYSS